MAWFSRQKPGVEESSSEGEKRVRTEGLWQESAKTAPRSSGRRRSRITSKSAPSASTISASTPRARLALASSTTASTNSGTKGFTSTDPLHFADSRKYSDRLASVQRQTSLSDALLSGWGTLYGRSVNICAMELKFVGGSMGAVMGEKITRAIERSIEKRAPLIVVSSSGGARMQEGAISLMQMAKISAALARLDDAKIPYISVLTDPTTGGVTASFAMLGDLNIAEPGALIGFAGPRVIEQTIRQKLPHGFQRSEFLLEHGFLDAVVKRGEMKHYIARALDFFCS